jgi:hypothetical protein
VGNCFSSSVNLAVGALNTFLFLHEASSMKMKIDNATSCLVDDAISIWFEVIYHFAYRRIGVNTDDYLFVLFEIIIYISSTCHC